MYLNEFIQDLFDNLNITVIRENADRMDIVLGSMINVNMQDVWRFINWLKKRSDIISFTLRQEHRIMWTES
jgi:hypothetical protein